MPDTRACLKKAFRELRVSVCGRFYLNEGGVAGYGNRMRVKYTAKWGLQIAEMIFQTRSMGGQRGQDNFKLAANFGYNSRGSADPRESLRNRRILKLALTAHTVLPTPGARLLLLSTDISTTPALLLHPIVPLLLPICSPPSPSRGQHSESPHLPDKDRQPFAGALSRDEIQSLEELDSERLSANWHLSSS